MKRLCRSRENKVLAGVCGGIAEYFATDPTIVRLVWAVFAITGAGIVAYFVALVIMPYNDEYTVNSSVKSDFDDDDSFYTEDPMHQGEDLKADIQKRRNLFGVILIGLGVIFLAKQIFSWFNFNMFWPAVFIAIGLLIILKGGRKII